MANAWFRLYSEFSDDPKVQMMSEAMQRRLIMLFCSRCKGETLHETEMAFHWRVTETELMQTKAVFLEKGFIDDHWELQNWNRRQFLSDSSTDRVRRHRQSMKQDETLQKQPVTEPVTPPEQNRTDTDQIQKHKKLPSRCEEIYLAYPRKVGRQAAITAIRSAVKREVATGITCEAAEELISQAVKQYAVSPYVRTTDASFIPHPQTWFNQGRYHDDPKDWQHTGGNNGQVRNNGYRTKSEITMAAAQNAARFDSEAASDPSNSATGYAPGAGIFDLLSGIGRVPDSGSVGSNRPALPPGRADGQDFYAEPWIDSDSVPVGQQAPPRG